MPKYEVYSHETVFYRVVVTAEDEEDAIQRVVNKLDPIAFSDYIDIANFKVDSVELLDK